MLFCICKGGVSIRKFISKKNVIILIFSILFVLLYSYSTLYTIGSTDSSIFLTIGKFWSKGIIPYSYLFDHKGPIIFFINMLSYKIFDCSQGVILFQIISMFFTGFFLEKIAYLELKDKSKSLLITLLTFCFLSILYNGGNLTEEYCLPFITCCLYFNLKFINGYVNERNFNHKRIYAFIYGISISFCFLTRLTNSISIFIGILIIIILLLKEKQYKLLLQNFAFLILGFAVLFLPFAIYFLVNNCLYEFIYGTLLYNFDYTSNLFAWLYSGNILKIIIVYFICYFPSYSIIIVGILNFKKNKKIKALLYILLGIVENLFFLIGNLYSNYSIITLPNIVIFLSEFDNYFKYYKEKMYILIIIAWLLFNIIFIIDLNKLKLNDIGRKIDEIVLKLDNKNSFVALNLDNYKEIYINNNIVPFYKYFVLQDWQAKHSDKMKLDLVEIFEKGNVEYILTQNEKGSVVYDVILKKYFLIDSITYNDITINLYRLIK